MSTTIALKDLKKELPYKWRVQSANQWGASCVAYIDARFVQDILDDVCGAENWQVQYSEHKGNLFASIGILTNGIWVWKSDCGTESAVEKQKGEASDAFKRAGVMWGIGRFLYSKKIVKLPVKENDAKKWIPFVDNKFVLDAKEITRLCELKIPPTATVVATPIVTIDVPRLETRIKACKTLVEVQVLWESLSEAERITVLKVKEEMKEKLTPKKAS